MADKDIKEMGLGELIQNLVISHLTCEKLTQTGERADGTTYISHYGSYSLEIEKIAIYKAELDRREKMYLPLE